MTRATGNDTHGFLGDEFLLWLWWKWTVEGGEFSLPGGRVVGVALDDYLVFAASSDDETQQTLRRGLPTRTAEARTSLQQGHRPTKARLLVAEGQRQWMYVLDAACMACGSVKLPEDAEECDSDVDRTADRVANWLALHELVQALYALFLRVRFGDGWKKEAVAIARWMAS